MVKIVCILIKDMQLLNTLKWFYRDVKKITTKETQSSYLNWAHLEICRSVCVTLCRTWSQHYEAINTYTHTHTYITKPYLPASQRREGQAAPSTCVRPRCRGHSLALGPQGTGIWRTSPAPAGWLEPQENTWDISGVAGATREYMIYQRGGWSHKRIDDISVGWLEPQENTWDISGVAGATREYMIYQRGSWSHKRIDDISAGWLEPQENTWYISEVAGATREYMIYQRGGWSYKRIHEISVGWLEPQENRWYISGVAGATREYMIYQRGDWSHKRIHDISAGWLEPQENTWDISGVTGATRE